MIGGGGSGKIIDSYDNQSSETDLIIYFKRVFSPLFFDINKGVFPLESCGFAFEIKTKSTSSEIKSTIKKFDILKNLKIIEPWSDHFPEYKLKPIRIYLAIETDLKVKDELERYKSYDDNHEFDPSIEILCIVGKGVWIFQNKTKYADEPNTYWHFYPNNGNHEELLILFGKMINQVVSVATEGGLDLIRYLMELDEEIFSRKIIK